jgi:hypothetical protein
MDIEFMLIKLQKTHLEEIWLESMDHPDYQSPLSSFLQQVINNIKQIYFREIKEECVLDYIAKLSGRIFDGINSVEGKPFLNLSGKKYGLLQSALVRNQLGDLIGRPSDHSTLTTWSYRLLPIGTRLPRATGSKSVAPAKTGYQHI